MEPTKSIQNPVVSQQTLVNHDTNSWKAFMKKCDPDQRKALMNNLTRHLSLIIAKNLRKMKETAQKMKEEMRK